MDINTIADSIELTGTRISCARNVEIFGEGEPAGYLYKVVTGSVRISELHHDGRRGPTIETVSRTMTQLENEAAIGAIASHRAAQSRGANDPQYLTLISLGPGGSRKPPRSA